MGLCCWSFADADESSHVQLAALAVLDLTLPRLHEAAASRFHLQPGDGTAPPLAR